MPRTLTPLDEVLDLLSPLGASVLAEHINAYWAAKGGQAGAERYEIPGGGGWGVRSRLVGGLPVKGTRPLPFWGVA